MTDPPPLQGSSSPPSAVDGIVPPTPGGGAARVPAPPGGSAPRGFLILVAGALYLSFIGWSVFLLMMFPSPAGGQTVLLQAGLASSLASGIVFLGLGFLFFQRIAQPSLSLGQRQRGLIRAVLIVLPGLLLSGAVPYLITREPRLTMDITDPMNPEDLVAPVPVTLSVERAVDILRQRGRRPVQYSWDTDGDGRENVQTIEPSTAALYERQGSYAVAVRILLDDGTFRRVARRLVIPRAVFSVTPLRPVVEKPVRFSVSHLLSDPKLLKEVQWDIDGDGEADEVSKTTEILHTYYAVGRVSVSAVVLLQNNTQVTYQRAVDIQEPPPLPFAVKLLTEPKILAGPPPFGAIFTLETEEPLREVHWAFGDGKEERGVNVLRVGHSYDNPGIYPVVARLRSTSGSLAELTALIKVTETLHLSDLQFSGKPDVSNSTIRGEAPLTVQLTPKTAVPLIQFQWEADGGTPITVAGTAVQAVYRREGSYTLTLIAQDPEGKVLRLPLKVEVDPPSAEPAFTAQPEGGVAPLTVTFDATDTFIPPGQEIAGFKWRFGDEPFQQQDNAQLGVARVEHTYTAPGEYAITLILVMASGKEYTAQRTIVVRKPTLSACITASRLRVQVRKGIEFDSSCSAGSPVSILWDVRYDAQPDVVEAQSPETRYVHIFDKPGSYTVTLTAKDRWGNQEKRTISITVDP